MRRSILLVAVAALAAIWFDNACAEDWSPLWSTATLSQVRAGPAAASAGNDVLFGGGWTPSNSSNVVDIYNTSTNTWSTASLSQARYAFPAASAGNDILFAGGYTGSSYSNVVDIYNTSTNTWSTTTLSQARDVPAASSVGNDIFFGGGYTGSSASNVVDIYNTSTSTWTTASLSQARYNLAVACAGNDVLFAGGETTSGAPSNVVDIYNTSTSVWSTATLSQARYNLAATSVNNDVLFAGGETTSGAPSNVVDIYNTSTNTWSTASLSQARYDLTAASAGSEAFFAGGSINGNPSGASNVVDIYNASTNGWSTASLSQARYYLSATSAGNDAFFAPGDNATNGDPTSLVDIYRVQNYPTITSSSVFTLCDQTTVAGLMQLNAPGSLSFATFNLNVGSMSGNAPIDLGNGTLTVGNDNTSNTYSGIISDSGTLVKTGSGMLVLSGNNTYNGGTTILGGTLQIGNGGTTGAITGNVTNNAVLSFNRSDNYYTFGNSIAGSGSFVMCGTGTLALTGTVSSGNITVNQGQVLANPGSLLTCDLTIPAAGRFTNNGGCVYVTNLSNSGTFVGSGQINGNFVNAPSGNVRIAAGQSLYIQNAGPTSNAGLIQVIGTGASQAQFESAGPFTNASGGGSGMIAAQNATLEFDGGLCNQASVLFSYGISNVFGTVTNSPSGNISIAGGAGVTFYGDVAQNGTLVVSTVGNIQSSAVFAGAFSGSGGFTGGGDVFFEGDLRPSDPVAVTFGGNAYLEGSTNTVMQLAGPAAGRQYDQIKVTGQLVLAGDLDLVLVDGFQPQADESFQLFDGELSGAFSQLTLPALSNGLQWSTSNLDTNGTISVTPEPSTLVLLAAGAVGLLGYGWRCRKAARRTAKPAAFDQQADAPAILSFSSHSAHPANVAQRAA